MTTDTAVLSPAVARVVHALHELGKTRGSAYAIDIARHADMNPGTVGAALSQLHRAGWTTAVRTAAAHGVKPGGALRRYYRLAPPAEAWVRGEPVPAVRITTAPPDRGEQQQRETQQTLVLARRAAQHLQPGCGWCADPTTAPGPGVCVCPQWCGRVDCRAVDGFHDPGGADGD